jgi:hypothetical protein
LAIFQLSSKAKTRGGKLVVSSRFPFPQRCISDVEKEMQLRAVIMATPAMKKMQL